MTKKGIYRVEIKPEILPALRVEAAIRGIGEKELVNNLVLGGLSEKAKEFLGEGFEKIECGSFAEIDKSQKPKPKSKLDPKVIAQIKEAWISTHNRSEISRQTGIERAKVSRYVIRLINDGELKE